MKDEVSLKQECIWQNGIISDELKDIILLLLDYFAEATGYAIAFCDVNGTQLWSSNPLHFSPICSKLKSIDKLWKVCCEDHYARSTMTYFDNSNKSKSCICHLGLWNISMPIVYENIFYGALITGQRKKKEDIVTLNIFQKEITNLFENNLIDQQQYNDILMSYTHTEQIENFPEISLNRLQLLENKLIDIIKTILVRSHKVTLLRHELHQPNNSARGFLEKTRYNINYLIDSNASPSHIETLKEMLTDISFSISSCKLFGAIIENICDSLTTNAPSLIKKKCNIIEMIDTVQRIFSDLAKDKDVIFTPIDLRYSSVTVINADESLLMRAFINAFHNAVKYSFYGQSEPRTIFTRIEDSGRNIDITISNYGIGILSDEVESIWKANVRGKLSADRHRTGSGLGLFQIREIVKLHGGKAVIYSTPQSNDIIMGPYLTELIISLPSFISTSSR